jgi:hypothetical protein
MCSYMCTHVCIQLHVCTQMGTHVYHMFVHKSNVYTCVPRVCAQTLQTRYTKLRKENETNSDHVYIHVYTCLYTIACLYTNVYTRVPHVCTQMHTLICTDKKNLPWLHPRPHINRQMHVEAGSGDLPAQNGHLRNM